MVAQMDERPPSPYQGEKYPCHIDTRAHVKQLVLNQHARSFGACQRGLTRVIVTRVVTVLYR